MESKPIERRGRPRKDPNVAVRHGRLMQLKIPKIMHQELKAAAAEEKMALTAFARTAISAALKRRRKSA
jgi:predicted HicB family RNase H-like nuclease